MASSKISRGGSEAETLLKIKTTKAARPTYDGFIKWHYFSASIHTKFEENLCGYSNPITRSRVRNIQYQNINSSNIRQVVHYCCNSLFLNHRTDSNPSFFL